LPDQVDKLAFSADGRRLATAGRERAAHVWDPADGRLLATIDHGGYRRTSGFSPDGRQLVTAAGRARRSAGAPTPPSW
jgi:WD40 repeat protein